MGRNINVNSSCWCLPYIEGTVLLCKQHHEEDEVVYLDPALLIFPVLCCCKARESHCNRYIQLYSCVSLIVTIFILLVPGLLGSQLEAKLDKVSSPGLLCSKKSDWFTLWVELDSAVPGFDKCFVDNIKY